MEILNYVVDDYIQRKLPKNNSPFSVQLQQAEYQQYKQYEENKTNCFHETCIIQFFTAETLSDYISGYLFQEGYIASSGNSNTYILTDKGLEVKVFGSVTAHEYYLKEQKELDKQLKKSTLDTNRVSRRLTRLSVGILIFTSLITLLTFLKTSFDRENTQLRLMLDRRLKAIDSTLKNRKDINAITKNNFRDTLQVLHKRR